MSLQDFQRRMGIPLAKSTHPDDFAAIRRETDVAGQDVVDHTSDLKGHPRSMDLKVEEYRKAIGHGAPLMRVTPAALHGQSAKVLYKVHTATNLPEGKPVLVKAYHEKLHHKCKFWQKHPIQGWAEMTNQSLFHAAGMGDVHQQVHVSEHDMGPGFDKHPAIVIHMEPNSKYIGEATPADFDAKMGADAVKVGVMDFLANNIDRHRANLLFRPPDAKNSAGMPFSSRLIAIDHGRNFQYHASHKGMPEKVEDPFLGPLTIPAEERAAKDAEAKSVDNLLFYLQGDAMNQVSMAGRGAGAPPLHHPEMLHRIVSQWWPEVRNRVITAFGDRLEGIKEPRMKEHLRENFQVRVEKLDDLAARPDWYKTDARVHDLDVPLKVWDR